MPRLAYSIISDSYTIESAALMPCSTATVHCESRRHSCTEWKGGHRIRHNTSE